MEASRWPVGLLIPYFLPSSALASLPLDIYCMAVCHSHFSHTCYSCFCFVHAYRCSLYWHKTDLWEIIFLKKKNPVAHPGNLLLIPPLPPQCLPLPVPYLPTFAWLSAVLTLVASYPLSFSFSTTTLPFLKPCSQLIKPCSQPAETFSQTFSTCSNLSDPFLCCASTKLAQNSKI